jgi:hypothetical protein
MDARVLRRMRSIVVFGNRWIVVRRADADQAYLLIKLCEVWKKHVSMSVHLPG